MLMVAHYFDLTDELQRTRVGELEQESNLKISKIRPEFRIFPTSQRLALNQSKLGLNIFNLDAESRNHTV